MRTIEDFDTYKAEFLAANKQPREHVLLRRVKDGQLTWAPAEAVGHYDGHEVEPFGDEEPKPAKAAKVTPPEKKAKGVPKAGNKLGKVHDASNLYKKELGINDPGGEGGEGDPGGEV